MAPIHHHFEMMEWTENKIIVRFWIMAAIFGASGFVLYYLFFSSTDERRYLVVGSGAERGLRRARRSCACGRGRRCSPPTAAPIWTWGGFARSASNPSSGVTLCRSKD